MRNFINIMAVVALVSVSNGSMILQRSKNGLYPTVSIETRRINKLLVKVLAGMQPPENLTVSEWAEEKRRLSSESSAETGSYRVNRTPYLREVMDAFTDPKVRRLILVSSSKSGDCMWNIALHFYGDGTQYMKIYEANRGVIGSNPALIYPGQVLTIPA